MRSLWTLLLLVAAFALGNPARPAAACPDSPPGLAEWRVALAAPAACVADATRESYCGPVAAGAASSDASGDDGNGSDSERGSSDASLSASTGFDAPSSNARVVRLLLERDPSAGPASPSQRPPRS